MKKVKIGVIGLGSIGEWKHLMQIDECEDLLLTAICDVDKEKLKEFSEKYSIDKAHCYTDYKDLINCVDVEAVDICTPNDMHFQMAMDCVSAGKPYALEKPITLNAEQGDILAEQTKKNGIKSMVSFSYRYISAVRYARELIGQGKIGKIYHVNMEYSQGWGVPSHNTPLVWRFIKERSGSGTLGDLGCHGIDLVRFVTDCEYTKVVAQAGTYVHERNKTDGSGIGIVDVDDYCNCLAEMEGNISATFHFTRFAPGRSNYQRMEIYGSEGSIIYDILKSTVEVHGKAFSEDKEFIEIPVPEEFDAIQLQAFADIVNGCEDGLSATIFDGQINQHTVDAIIKSFENGVWVNL